MLKPNFHKPFPILETPRLVIRDLAVRDAEDFLAMRRHPEVLKHLCMQPMEDIAAALRFIEKMKAGAERDEYIHWAIARKEDDCFLGTIVLWNLEPEHYKAETGFMLHPDHWRKGIMKEALNAVLSYGFDEMGLHKITGVTRADNIASATLMKTAGFALEGTLRDNVRFDGRYFDEHLFGIIRH